MSGFNTTHPDSSPRYGLSYQSGGSLSADEIRLAEENRVATLVRKAAVDAARRIPPAHRDDAVQTVTFAVLQRIRDGFELRDEQIPGYAFVAIQHARLKIEHRERTRVMHETRLAQTLADETSSWQQGMHRAEVGALTRAYERAAAGLSAECRSAFEMIQLRQYTVAEVSATTGVKETTLRKRVAAAQRHLRKHFGRDGNAGNGNRDGAAT